MTKMELDVLCEVDTEQVRDWLLGSEEIAFVDVRETGQFGLGHALLAVNIPYSRLEADIGLRVPLRSTRTVIVDANDGIAAKAVARLRTLGYANLHTLAGGVESWRAAGYELFDGTNVPSKAFAEILELTAHTPAISAEELFRLQTSGENLVILDPRTPEEFSRFHVPGARNAPGVELVAHAADLAPSPATLIVVSCAGRTRGIIGAQGLIDAGVPNKVVSLAGGTQAWRLAGFALETSPAQSLPLPSAAATRAAQCGAERLRARHKIDSISRETLETWLSDTRKRTIFTFDVRTRAEYEAGHISGAIWAPGGQLVQALDLWVGVRNARLVLVDDDGARATVAAHWLKQMGWDASILIDSSNPTSLATGASSPISAADLPRVTSLSAQAARWWVAEQGKIVSTDPSAGFRASHPQGAHWVNRARLERLDPSVLGAARILVVGDDAATASLVAGDLQELTSAHVRVLAGGTQAWKGAGLPVESSQEPADCDRIDTLFWHHIRHDGDFDAMRGYLQWELDLPARIAADDTAGFRIRA